MNDEERKYDETGTMETGRKTDVERERFELDEQRLNLDIERIALEKLKERTAKLQVSLPILVSIVAIAFSGWSEYRRSVIQYNQGASSYNQGRLELFKRMTERTADSGEMKKAREK